jgi:hypothetical protein
VEISDGWVVLVLIVAAIGWWYVKLRIPSGKYRRGSEKQFQPTQAPAPQGPQAPAGLPMPPMEPPKGRYGPEYLTGQIKEESEAALQLIRENLSEDDRRQMATRVFKTEPDWPTLYAMAADFLGAMRWYQKVVAPAFTDRWLLSILRGGSNEGIASHMNWYRKKVAPGPDLDQALNILGFFMKHLGDTQGNVVKAWTVSVVALDRKVAKDKAAGHP